MSKTRVGMSIPTDKNVIVYQSEASHMPDGSPSFANVMNDIVATLPRQATISSHPKDDSADDSGSNDHVNSEIIGDREEVMSPIQLRKMEKNKFLVSGRPWSRTSSWNLRNKKASEKRKEIQRMQQEKWNVGRSTSESSASPSLQRRNGKGKKPMTPQSLRSQPAYKFVTETVTVSHEDLVNEQLNTSHLNSDDEFDSKSIFHTPKVYRRFTVNKSAIDIDSDSD